MNKARRKATIKTRPRVMTDPATEGGLMSRNELAAILGIKPASIASAECRGRPLLPKISVSGTLIRYRRSDLDKLLASRTTGVPVPA